MVTVCIHCSILQTIHAQATIRNPCSLSLSPHLQVLGDRTLMGHEVVGQLAAHEDKATGPGYLHVFVKLSDIDSLSLSTRLERQLFCSRTTQDWPRSALTAQLAGSPGKAEHGAAGAPSTPKAGSLR